MEDLASNMSHSAHVAEILKAVAHPLRIRIVALLCQKEEHVNGLADKLGVNQAIVSQQLQILRMRRLVGATRVGGFAHYRILEPQLRNLMKCMENCSA
ncbi:MAG: hypothetical protein A2X94_01880 [Bdellovibrionales bacterium GWB1_55_8]|nr:MAG: hypothetical protein A2X94_01880 [Bdellovibrionales bacterium GWB1_55_8]